MKNKEELNALMNEVEALNKKLAELSEEEFEQISGGANEKGTVFVTGTVTKKLDNNNFAVKLQNGGQIPAHLAGALRMKCINVFEGDQVKVEISLDDAMRGRIVAVIR